MSNMQEEITELELAQKLLMQSHSQTLEARSRETQALNRLNAAQKRIEALIGEMKKGAPSDSDWGRKP